MLQIHYSLIGENLTWRAKESQETVKIWSKTSSQKWAKIFI